EEKLLADKVERNKMTGKKEENGRDEESNKGPREVYSEYTPLTQPESES
ncbi:hypothetical protein A2U01_0105850, partial [Trifolium medium]|nr:hypothetical protein [Trifolium medium]